MIPPQPTCAVVRGLVLSAIDTCPDARTRARRIEIALQRGIITPAEAAQKRNVEAA